MVKKKEHSDVCHLGLPSILGGTYNFKHQSSFSMLCYPHAGEGEGGEVVTVFVGCVNSHVVTGSSARLISR